MFGWWKNRKEKKRLYNQYVNRYPIMTDNPYIAVIWKASQKFSAHIRRYGLLRKPAETTGQFYQRASRLNGIDQEALFAFRRIMDGSMFSNIEYGAMEKDLAIDRLREIERSLDGTSGKQDRPLTVYPGILPPEITTSGYSIEAHPEVLEYRFGRESGALDLMGWFAAGKVNEGITPTNKAIIKDLVKRKGFGDLSTTIMETADEVIGSIYLSRYAAYYSLELGYRIREVFGRSIQEVDALIRRVVEGAMVFSAADDRTYVLPDDIKLSLLAQFPRFQMTGSDESNKLADSVQVPSVNIDEFEVDIILANGPVQ
ncbi:MAG: hypothetical protein JW939_04065 [Candidatus Thermoplasmatota archaeon]|nr:hypothetical protein [Candidatus Thermoplasmatota archaeon]